MAKVSMINREDKRKMLAKKYSSLYIKLKSRVMDKTLTLEDRFEAQMQLSKLPRNSSKVRQRNRCKVTGRPRGYYRKFQLSRISLRELAAFGLIPGVKKSSW
jgi:small subunit ribosomal protein S14